MEYSDGYKGTGKQKEVVALILARGGSKSFAHKNIRELRGRPLIAYSIASALAAESVNKVVVTTDDARIAEIATEYGAEVPFLRPAELARDDTDDFPVVEHAVNWLRLQGNYEPDIVVQLRPTSPLRPRGLIDEAVKVFIENPGVDCVRGVVESSENPFKMWLIDKGGFMRPLMKGWFDEPYNMPRQKLPKTYWQTGHIDVIGIDTISSKKSLTGTKILPVFVEQKYCVDIDKIDELYEAEEILSSGLIDIDEPRDIFFSEHRNCCKQVIPTNAAVIVLDFDGVLTDNKVVVLGDGSEAVVCNRSDGMAVNLLCKANFQVIVLSQEVSPVVERRCMKMGLKCYAGQADKAERLAEISRRLNISLDSFIYVGNDVNDLECMRMVGCPIAVADAVQEVKDISKIVLRTKGGQGVVKELAAILKCQ